MSPATQVAYKHLSRYPKTTRQIREYLQKKWYEDNEIEDAINQLLQLNMLDDTLYAEMYLNSEVVNKWKPLMVVKQKMYQKWIPTELTTVLIDEYQELYQEWMINKLKKLRTQKKDENDTQKRIKRMIWRGYSYNIVKIAIETD